VCTHRIFPDVSISVVRGWAVHFVPSACAHECSDSAADADSESDSDSQQSVVSDDAGAESDDMPDDDSEHADDSEQDAESDASSSRGALSVESEASDGFSYHDLVGGEEGELAANTSRESPIAHDFPDSAFTACDDLLVYTTQSDLFLVSVTTFERPPALSPDETGAPANVPAPRVHVEQRIRGVCDGTLTMYRALHRLCHVEVIPQLGIVLVASSASDQVTMLALTRCVFVVALWRFCIARARSLGPSCCAFADRIRAASDSPSEQVESFLQKGVTYQSRVYPSA
jgi:hypothetical protein